MLNLNKRRKQYNKIDLLNLTVVPQLSGGWQHNDLTKTSQAGHANKQSFNNLMSRQLRRVFLWLKTADF